MFWARLDENPVFSHSSWQPMETGGAEELLSPSLPTWGTQLLSELASVIMCTLYCLSLFFFSLSSILLQSPSSYNQMTSCYLKIFKIYIIQIYLDVYLCFYKNEHPTRWPLGSGVSRQWVQLKWFLQGPWFTCGPSKRSMGHLHY